MALIYVKILFLGSFLSRGMPIDQFSSNFVQTKFISGRSGLRLKMSKFCQISTVMALDLR